MTSTLTRFEVGQGITTDQMHDLPTGAIVHWNTEDAQYVKLDGPEFRRVDPHGDPHLLHSIEGWVRFTDPNWIIDELPGPFEVGQRITSTQLYGLPTGAVIHWLNETTRFVKQEDDTFRSIGDPDGFVFTILSWRGMDGPRWAIDGLPGQPVVTNYTVGQVVRGDVLVDLPNGSVVHYLNEPPYIKGDDGLYRRTDDMEGATFDTVSWREMGDWVIDHVPTGAVTLPPIPAEALAAGMVVQDGPYHYLLVSRDPVHTSTWQVVVWRDRAVEMGQYTWTGQVTIVPAILPPHVLTFLLSERGNVQAQLAEQARQHQEWKDRFSQAANEYASENDLCGRYDSFMRQWDFPGRAIDYVVTVEVNARPVGISEGAAGYMNGAYTTVYNDPGDTLLHFNVSASAYDENAAGGLALESFELREGSEFEFNDIPFIATDSPTVYCVEEDE